MSDGRLCRVEIHDLAYSSGREKIISDVNFSMECGDITALIGKNGAGKTTLLRSMTGELRHEGEIRHIAHDGGQIHKVRIGYVPQRLMQDRAEPVTVSDFFAAANSRMPVWLGHSRRGRERTLEALSKTGSEGLIDKRLGNLSGGEMQRVLLAMALSPEPDLLLLDEPVAGMDSAGAEIFYSLMQALRRGRHIAVLMVSHDFEAVRKYADRVLLFNRNVIREGSPDEVLSSPEFRAEFYPGV